MQTLTCHKCKTALSIADSHCHNCADPKPFSGIKLSIQETGQINAKQRKSFILAGGKVSYSKKLWVSLSVSFFVIAAVVVLKSPSQEQKLSDNDRQALSLCRAAIDQRLTNPESAKYGYQPLDRVVMKKPDGFWLVQRGLKAKNKLGVMVPVKFGCDVSITDGAMTVTKLERYK